LIDDLTIEILLLAASIDESRVEGKRNKSESMFSVNRIAGFSIGTTFRIRWNAIFGAGDLVFNSSTHAIIYFRNR